MTTLTTDGEHLLIDGKQVLKGWESFSGWYWFGIEEIEPGLWFGFVQGLEEEWGYFSQPEIESLTPLTWPIKPCDLPYAGRKR